MKGKKKGFQKSEVRIIDPAIAPYYVVVEESQFSVMLEGSTIPQGYYSKLHSALAKIAHYKSLEDMNQSEISLQGYLDHYRDTVNTIIEKVQI